MGTSTHRFAARKRIPRGQREPEIAIQLQRPRAPFPCDLALRGVLITRPEAQAEALCQLVTAARGRPARFPAVTIQPVENPGPARNLLAQHWDLILFVSRNAVEHALPLLPNNRLPTGSQLAAVGAATAKALRVAGRPPDLVPANRFDSESLLALPELANPNGRRILIVRGAGGRALLGDALKNRGADLAYAEVYRRNLPKIDAAPWLGRWQQDIQLATVTSGEVLHNLITLLGPDGRDLLLATPLVVVSARTAKTAKELGFVDVELATHVTDAAIVAALCKLLERLQDA